ncbi:unnamed protein product [Linum trigynum]|uniref:Uncharacterized protein n=1 Tax=Linum trigynum TaxID=586398 RepID=A0AAV2EK08_9ROSI
MNSSSNREKMAQWQYLGRTEGVIGIFAKVLKERQRLFFSSRVVESGGHHGPTKPPLRTHSGVDDDDDDDCVFALADCDVPPLLFLFGDYQPNSPASHLLFLPFFNLLWLVRSFV